MGKMKKDHRMKLNFMHNSLFFTTKWKILYNSLLNVHIQCHVKPQQNGRLYAQFTIIQCHVILYLQTKPRQNGRLYAQFTIKGVDCINFLFISYLTLLFSTH